MDVHQVESESPSPAGLGRAEPEPPKFCRQCFCSSFQQEGWDRYRCQDCGDVAIWLSPEWRASARAALALSVPEPGVAAPDGVPSTRQANEQ